MEVFAVVPASPGVTMRECRPEEAEAVLLLWAQAGATPSVTDTAEQLRRTISAGPALVLIAELSGQVVGSVIGGFDGWRGNLYRLAVHPEYRRRGIARALVREAERRLVERGAARITALVEREHPWAMEFWQAAGYAMDTRMTRCVREFPPCHTGPGPLRVSAPLPGEMAGPLKRTIGYVSLVVRDYDEAIRFYTEALGFRLVEDTPLPAQQKRWVLLAPPAATETKLLLARAAGDEQASRIGNQTGGRVFLFLHTDNFWRDYSAYKRKGVVFVRPPSEEPYGTVAVFADLYGNLWDLLQLREREEHRPEISPRG
jgi:ribosomal protein S18 acetylase RimI-like enzyme/catechol 2,3-dioxygenase-like lactoylglutathione lyase family enzyme